MTRALCATGVFADQQPVGLYPRGDELLVGQVEKRGEDDGVARLVRRGHRGGLQGTVRTTVFIQ